MAALTWPLPPSTMTRSGIAQRRASSTPSSPFRTERNRRRRTSWWLAKSFGPVTVLILNRRYSPELGLPSSKTTMLPTDSLPWKLLMS